MSIVFDYQNKVWGTAIPSDSPKSLAGLRFHYFLQAIKGRDGKLLEIGSGAGGNLVGLERYNRSFRLYGVDISQAAIAFGTEHFPSLQLSVASAEHLPYSDNFFEVVCFFDVLEHVEDPSLCIQESVRVLDSDGIFHAYVPCEGELLSFHGILNKLGINLKEKTAGHIQKLRRRDLEKMCVVSGLELIEVRWSCHYLNQVGDLLYYLFLTVSGRRLTHSFESTFQAGRAGLINKALNFFKDSISSIWYWESRFLWFFPGAGVHITARKR